VLARSRKYMYHLPVIDSVSAAVPAPQQNIFDVILCIFSQFLSATVSPFVDRVSAPRTTPPSNTTPQMVVPVFVAPRRACRCFRVCEKSKPSADISCYHRAATLNPQRLSRVDFVRLRKYRQPTSFLLPSCRRCPRYSNFYLQKQTTSV